MILGPNYINLRPGEILAALIGGWAFVPWNIPASALAFLSFMTSYTVPFFSNLRLIRQIWLGPITLIMIAEC